VLRTIPYSGSPFAVFHCFCNPPLNRRGFQTQELGVTGMNWDQIEGKWKQYKGQAKVKWGKLTDDDLTAISGNRDQLIGKVQEYYGVTKENAQAQVDEFIQSLPPEEQARGASNR